MRTFAQPGSPVIEIDLNLFEEPTGQPRRHTQALLPGTNRLHVHPKKLAKHGLTQPERSANLLDLLRSESARDQVQPGPTNRVPLLDRPSGFDCVAKPLQSRDNPRPLGTEFSLVLHRPVLRLILSRTSLIKAAIALRSAAVRSDLSFLPHTVTSRMKPNSGS